MSKPDPISSFSAKAGNSIRQRSPAENMLPSFSAVIGEEASMPAPQRLPEKIETVNKYYEGLEAPYRSSMLLMQQMLAKNKALLKNKPLTKSEIHLIQQEVEELENGLAWALKKLNALEADRKLACSKIQ